MKSNTLHVVDKTWKPFLWDTYQRYQFQMTFRVTWILYYVSWFVNGFDHGYHCWTWCVKSKTFRTKTCHPTCVFSSSTPPHNISLDDISVAHPKCKTPKRQPHLLCDQHRIDELQVQALVGWAPQKSMVDYAHKFDKQKRIWRKNFLQHIESAPIKYRISMN